EAAVQRHVDHGVVEVASAQADPVGGDHEVLPGSSIAGKAATVWEAEKWPRSPVPLGIGSWLRLKTLSAFDQKSSSPVVVVTTVEPSGVLMGLGLSSALGACPLTPKSRPARSPENHHRWVTRSWPSVHV